MAFPNYQYCNLENPEIRLIAQQDPQSFFKLYPAPVILDEIQRVPSLLSWIQADVDEKRTNGQYILTGSQHLEMNAAITQSLAGRTALLTLLPFSLDEVSGFNTSGYSRDTFLYTGFLPRIYDQGQQPTTAYRNYLHTYVERDVRQLINLKDLTVFERFLRLLAGRTAQLLNIQSLSNDTGISATTVANWISVLEASYILFRLEPYYHNFGKRVIKSPKIYFIEPGLACYLLGIEDEKQVARDPLAGNLFENLVVVEALKARYNKGLDANLYFYRDSNQNEVDLIYKQGSHLFPIEIKYGSTWHDGFARSVLQFNALAGNSESGAVVYGGENNFQTRYKVNAVGYQRISQFLNSI